MFSNIIFISLPYIFVLFFIFFEVSPSYVFENQIIKPYMFILVLYCWIIQDYKKFSPISIFFLCTFYDLIQGSVVGITCIFFLMLQYTIRKEFNDLSSYDFKENWIKFMLSFTSYLSIILLSNISFLKLNLSIKNITISYLATIILFPLFNSIVEKLS